jgi:hypothetical protein
MTTWNERKKAVIEEFRTHRGQVKGWAVLATWDIRSK